MAEPNFFSQWSAEVSKKLDQMSDKIDSLQKQSIDLWQKHHDEVEKLKTELRSVDSKLAAHSTELTVWRWALLICLGMIITAVMQFSITHYQGLANRAWTDTIQK